MRSLSLTPSKFRGTTSGLNCYISLVETILCGCGHGEPKKLKCERVIFLFWLNTLKFFHTSNRNMLNPFPFHLIQGFLPLDNYWYVGIEERDRTALYWFFLLGGGRGGSFYKIVLYRILLLKDVRKIYGSLISWNRPIRSSKNRKNKILFYENYFSARTVQA